MGESSGSVELVVYGRDYCHLCEEMIEALGGLESVLGFRLRVVNVDDDAALEERYGDRVPVLEGAGKEICHYILNRTALDAFLAKVQ
jgi:thiol-disulfide isomerase/thioredoxin